MRKRRARQYTIRAVPEALDKALRLKAKQEGKSLNAIAVDALKRAIGLGETEPIFRDLDDFIGTWVEDPAFDAAIAEQDVVDPEIWR